MSKKFKSIKISEETYNFIKEICDKEYIKISTLVELVLKGKIKIERNNIIKNN